MEQPRKLLSATTLIGDKVVNNDNETVGKITELMIDLASGNIGYAVMSSGGILGIGDKLFALPWRTLKVDQENKCFILNVDKDRLEKAPGFDKDNWPDMADPTWTQGIQDYWR